MPASPYYTTSDSTVSAVDAAVVTASDSLTIPVTRALYIGSAGNIAVTLAKGSVVTFANVTSGSILPVQAVKVMATGTTVTGVLALY